jgi:hypothetical protein
MMIMGRYGMLNTARKLVELGANPNVVDSNNQEPTAGHPIRVRTD